MQSFLVKVTVLIVSHCINIFIQISTRVPATWYCRRFVSLSWPNIHGKSRCFCGPECRHHGWLSFTGVCWISPAAFGWTFNPGYRGKNLVITVKIVIILLLPWNLCFAVILWQIVIVLVSPGTHLEFMLLLSLFDSVELIQYRKVSLIIVNYVSLSPRQTENKLITLVV